MRFCLLLAALLPCTACKTTSNEKPAPPPATKSTYGAPIRGTETLRLASVLSEPESYRGKAVVVEGEVRRACSRKGCWMEIAESLDSSARGARVTFKDYGFFVPTSSAGAHARLEGVVNVETMKAAQVEHLESEGAKVTNKNADGTAREVQLIATGVELTRPL